MVPPDPGYGDAVLGLHLYSWASVVIVTVLIVSGINLAFINALQPRDVRYGVLSAVVIGLLALVILGNVVSMFALEGLHWTLPDDPDRYRLFEDLRALLGRK